MITLKTMDSNRRNSNAHNRAGFGIILQTSIMAYALQSLLRIRTMREDRASGELVAARQAVVAAKETLERRQHVLADYEKTRESRRDRLYDTVIGKAVTREQLDKVKEGVAKIDEEGVLKAEDVRRAQEELNAREETADRARSAYFAAAKGRMKIDEHRANWLNQERDEQERRAEGELEDFTRRPHDD